MEAETPYVQIVLASPTSEAMDVDDDIPVGSQAGAEASPPPEEPTPVPRPDPATEPRLDPAMEPRPVPANVPAASSKAANPPPPRHGGISAPPHWPRWAQICMENRPKAPAPPPPWQADLSPEGAEAVGEAEARPGLAQETWLL